MAKSSVPRLRVAQTVQVGLKGLITSGKSNQIRAIGTAEWAVATRQCMQRGGGGGRRRGAVGSLARQAWLVQRLSLKSPSLKRRMRRRSHQRGWVMRHALPVTPSRLQDRSWSSRRSRRGKRGPPCPGAVDLGRIDPATWIMGAPNPKSIWSGCVSCGVCACVRACVCKSLAFISSSIHQQEAVCKHACDSRLLNVFAWLQYYHPV